MGGPNHLLSDANVQVGQIPLSTRSSVALHHSFITAADAHPPAPSHLIPPSSSSSSRPIIHLLSIRRSLQ